MPVLVEIQRDQQGGALSVECSHEVGSVHLELQVVDSHSDALSSVQRELGATGGEKPPKARMLPVEEFRPEEVGSQHIYLGVAANPACFSAATMARID